jgi:hypothetical protein
LLAVLAKRSILLKVGRWKLINCGQLLCYIVKKRSEQLLLMVLSTKPVCVDSDLLDGLQSLYMDIALWKTSLIKRALCSFAQPLNKWIQVMLGAKLNCYYGFS